MHMQMHMPVPMQRPRGFTLIELLVVMAVLGLLSLAVYPLAEVNLRRERERELRHALWEIRDAIDAYKLAVDAGQVRRSTQSGYPPDLQALAQGGAVSPAGQPQYFLRRLPRDPFADPALPAAATWGLRSFASPPEAPRYTNDVFDVYSQAPGAGLNGQPLREW